MLPLHIVRAAAAHTAPVPQNPFLLRQQRGKSDVAPAKTTRAGNNPASGWTTALLRFWCIIMHVHRGNVRSTVCFMPAVRFSDAVARPKVTRQQDALTRVSIARGENVRIRGRVVVSCKSLPACFLASSLFATSWAPGACLQRSTVHLGVASQRRCIPPGPFPTAHRTARAHHSETLFLLLPVFYTMRTRRTRTCIACQGRTSRQASFEAGAASNCDKRQNMRNQMMWIRMHEI
jgi:hypothetical protein